MGCGKCGPVFPGGGCKCDECKEDLCNQPINPIKKCYVGRPDISGEYKEEMCNIFNNDGCKTIEHNGGRSAQDYEKSCGKCPAPDELPKGSKCTNCSDMDLCNIDKDKGSIKQCFAGNKGKFEKEDCKFYNNDGCLTIECGDGKSAEDYYKSCGKCPASGEDFSFIVENPVRRSCKCTECTDGDLCNTDKDKGSIKQCYMGNSKTGKFEKEDCKYYNNDGCHTFQCGDLFDNPEFYKSCGKCPALGDGAFSIKDQSMRDCNCIDCATGNLCNEDKDIGSTKQCYSGRPDSPGKFKMEDCKFYNNDGCRTFQCGDLSKNPEFFKYCGTTCPAHGDDTSLLPKEVRDRIDCKCSNCTGNLCNEDKNKDKKSCGKCPPSEKLDPGCKCEECIGELCNKEVTVNQCYWGDDQKGYEAIDCKAPHNTACKKVKCRGDNHYTNPETGKPGFKHHRDCGKCSEGENEGDCRCFTCKDKDLCNGDMYIGFSSLVLILAMIGGAIALLGMKPLVGIGI